MTSTIAVSAAAQPGGHQSSRHRPGGQQPAPDTALGRPRVPAGLVEGADRGQGGYDHLVPLLVELAALDAADPRYGGLRAQLIVGYRPVAAHLAARYRGRGQPVEDLEQVAVLGLIKAVDRFDPTRGVPFLAYLVPTATGEILRYFRDHTWATRPPRRLTDLHVVINRARDPLANVLGRAPRPEEIAAHLGATVGDVVAALRAGQAYHAVSFDDPLEAARASRSSTTSGSADTTLDRVEIQAALRGVLVGLPDRERRILALRFVADLTQAEIGEAVGLSQMHISRILIATLDRLRIALQAPAPAPRRSGPAPHLARDDRHTAA